MTDPLSPELMSNDFEQLVDRYYTALFRFALTMARNESDASDLTQQTFFLWASKGHQLRDKSKVKSWLFTTLYREYVSTYRHQARFPHVELEDAGAEMPSVSPALFDEIDGAAVVAAISDVDEVFRVPLSLFYLEELSYQEIADALKIPIGTVMSRLSRGKVQLRTLLLERQPQSSRKIVPLPDLPQKGGA